MIAIYARQSLDKKDSISIESQIDLCIKEANKKDYKIYKDKGFSGKNTDRPEMQKLLKDIKNDSIEKVIVYKLDRISRSILDFNNLMEEFKKHNVEFVSVTEKFDTSTPMGRAMLNIVVTFAQLEREQIAQRVKDNYYQRGKTGRFLGGKIPLGYNRIKIEIDGKKVPVLEVKEDEALLIKRMFNMYSETDMSLGTISATLNNEGYKSANGKAWDSGKISRILKNALYVQANIDVYNYYKAKGVIINNNPEDFNNNENGCFVYGKRDTNTNRYTNLKNHNLTIGMHKGIIDSKTFLKCQYKLDNNKQLCRSGSGKHTWLTGLTKCGYCGYSVSVVMNGQGDKYMSCRGKTNLKICDGFNKAIRLNTIEEIISVDIQNKLKELANGNYKIANKNKKIIDEIENNIKIIDNQINNLLEKIIEANSITMKYINNKIEELDNERNELKAKLGKLILEKNSDNTLKNFFENEINFYELDFDEKKKIAKLLISKIKIKDDEIIVEWNVN